MELFLKKILATEQLDKLYSFNHMHVIDICKYLNIELSESELVFYQRYLDRSNSDELIDSNLIYGEISRSGVNSIIDYINNKLPGVKKIYDIGSGSGKLAMHIALITGIEVVGIEIDKWRYEYSQHILNNLQIDGVEFIHEDFNNLDISDADLVICNDTVFTDGLISQLEDKIPVGCNLISFNKNRFKPVSTFELSISWVELLAIFRHTVKIQ